MQEQASQLRHHRLQQEVDKRHDNFVHQDFDGISEIFQGDNVKQIRQQQYAKNQMVSGSLRL